MTEITTARNFPQFVRKLRRKYGLSQMELGKMAGFKTGQFISNIERGRVPFSVSLSRKLFKMKVLSYREAKFLNELCEREWLRALNTDLKGKSYVKKRHANSKSM